MNKSPFIHILWNDLNQAENCPLCGNLHHDASLGLWLFVSGLDGEPQRICWACGEDFALELLEIVIGFNRDKQKLEAGLYRKMDSRFDELFEEFKYLRVSLKELPLEEIQTALIDEIQEILNSRWEL